MKQKILMKRILVAVLLLAAFAGIGNSKNFSVVGVVVDSLENEPVPYATLRVDKHGGTEPTLGISGVDGAPTLNRQLQNY